VFDISYKKGKKPSEEKKILTTIAVNLFNQCAVNSCKRQNKTLLKKSGV